MNARNVQLMVAALAACAVMACRSDTEERPTTTVEEQRRSEEIAVAPTPRGVDETPPVAAEEIDEGTVGTGTTSIEPESEEQGIEESATDVGPGAPQRDR
jgi:hypothetical protein